MAGQNRRHLRIDNIHSLCLHSLRGLTAPLPGQHLSDEQTRRDQLPLADIQAFSVSGWGGVPPPVQQEEERPSARSARSQSSTGWRFPIEPAVVLYYMAFQGSQPVLLQYVYSRLLEDIKSRPPSKGNHTKAAMVSECEGPDAADFDEQQEAQAIAGFYIMLSAACLVLPALLSTVMLGAHSDHAGRKWGLLPPTIGESLHTLLCIATVSFKLPVLVIIIGQVVEGMFGNASLYLMTCFAYTVDVSSLKERSMKIIMVDILAGLAYTVAQIVFGLLIRRMGFLYSFYIIFCIYLLNLIYIIFLLPETVQREKPEKLFTLDRFRETLRLYKQDGGLPKRVLLLGIFIIATYMVADQASGAPLTLYFLNSPLCWTSEYIGYFKALEYVVRYLACLALVWLLRRHLSESALLIIGCVSCILYNIVLAQATETWIAFLSTSAGFGMELVTAMSRTICSKNVGPRDQGALFSSQGWIALTSALVGAVSFSAVYSGTLYLVHGFIYYVAAAIFVFLTVLAM